MTAPEVARLDKAMSSGDANEQKQVLAELVATRDQERTQGSDIRDSKNLLDNIKTSLADKLIPLTEQMRAGIIYMAGGKDKLTTEDIMRRVVENDSKGRTDAINTRFNGEIGKLEDQKSEYESSARSERYIGFVTSGETYAKAKASAAEFSRLAEETEKKIQALKEEQAKLLAKENARREQEIKDLTEAAAKRREQEDAAREAEDKRRKLIEEAGAGGSGPGRYGQGGSGGSSSTGGQSAPYAPLTGDVSQKMSEAERRAGLPPGVLQAVFQQETSGNTAYINDPAKYHYGLDANGRRIAPHTGKISTAFGPFGILESTAKNPGYGVSPLKDKSLDEQIRFTSEYLAARTKSAGSLSAGLAGYGEGFAYSNSVMRKMRNINSTPMPDDAVAARRIGDQYMNVRGTFDPLAITVNYPDGKQAAPPAYLNPYFNRSSPFGQSS